MGKNFRYEKNLVGRIRGGRKSKFQMTSSRKESKYRKEGKQ